MKNLIELDMAIDVVDKRIRQIGYENNALVLSIRQAVRDIEPVDAVPVRRGRWKMVEGELAFWDMCSKCGRKILHRTPYYYFCPNCGAKMDGDNG